MNSKRKSNIVLYAAVILFLLVCLSTRILFSGLYARYISTDTAEDDARVASFSVSAVSNALDSNISFSTGESEAIYEISLNNASEVAVSATVKINVNLPAGFVITLDDNAPTNVNGNVYTFENAASLNVSDSESCILKFVGDYGDITAAGVLIDNFSFETTVTFTQID